MPAALTDLAATAAVAAFTAPAPPLAFLEGIGAMEMMLVAIIGLLLFGGKGLPDMARTVGRVVREFKKATANVENEVKRVMHEEPAPPPQRRRARPLAPTDTPPPTAPSSAPPTPPEPPAAP
jgi:sec-independent protein translocase protein TatA